MMRRARTVLALCALLAFAAPCFASERASTESGAPQAPPRASTQAGAHKVRDAIAARAAQRAAALRGKAWSARAKGVCGALRADAREYAIASRDLFALLAPTASERAAARSTAVYATKRTSVLFSAAVTGARSALSGARARYGTECTAGVAECAARAARALFDRVAPPPAPSPRVRKARRDGDSAARIGARRPLSVSEAKPRDVAPESAPSVEADGERREGLPFSKRGRNETAPACDMRMAVAAVICAARAGARRVVENTASRAGGVRAYATLARDTAADLASQAESAALDVAHACAWRARGALGLPYGPLPRRVPPTRIVSAAFHMAQARVIAPVLEYCAHAGCGAGVAAVVGCVFAIALLTCVRARRRMCAGARCARCAVTESASASSCSSSTCSESGSDLDADDSDDVDGDERQERRAAEGKRGETADTIELEESRWNAAVRSEAKRVRRRARRRDGGGDSGSPRRARGGGAGRLSYTNANMANVVRVRYSET